MKGLSTYNDSSRKETLAKRLVKKRKRKNKRKK